MTETTNHHLWMPVPGYAIPVTVTLDGHGAIDPLCKVIFELCRIQKRTRGELERLLPFDQDILSSGIEWLLDTRTIEEEGAHCYVVPADSTLAHPHDIAPGWIYCHVDAQRQMQVLPMVWLGEHPRPHLDSADFERVKELGASHSAYFAGLREVRDQPSRKSARDLVAHMLKHQDVIAYEHAPDDEPALTTAPCSGQVLSICIDEQRAREGHLATYIPLWVRVEFLPRFVGPAIAVYRSPDLAPNPARHRPMDDAIGRWIEEEPLLEEHASHIRGHAEALSVEMSVLLKEARIDGKERFDDLKADARARLEDRYERFPTNPHEELEVMRDYLEQALEWSIIAERSDLEKHNQTFMSKIAHAAEELCKRLRLIATPELRAWESETWRGLTKKEAKTYKKERAKIEYYKDRAGDVGIHDAFDASRPHILKLVENLRHPDALGALDTAAAGANICYWMLPILLLDKQDAARFGEPIEESIRRYPGLNQAFLDLLDLRNSTFHNRDDFDNEYANLRSVFDVLYRCTCAIANAYARTT